MLVGTPRRGTSGTNGLLVGLNFHWIHTYDPAAPVLIHGRNDRLGGLAWETSSLKGSMPKPNSLPEFLGKISGTREDILTLFFQAPLFSQNPTVWLGYGN